jgi:hypothetical protein
MLGNDPTSPGPILAVDRGVDLAGGRSADQQRDVEAFTLHLVGDMHLEKARSGRRTDDIALLAARG